MFSLRLWGGVGRSFLFFCHDDATIFRHSSEDTQVWLNLILKKKTSGEGRSPWLPNFFCFTVFLSVHYGILCCNCSVWGGVPAMWSFLFFCHDDAIIFRHSSNDTQVWLNLIFEKNKFGFQECHLRSLIFWAWLLRRVA